MWTVGMRVLFGAGSVGAGPTPALNGSFAVSPQAATLTASAKVSAVGTIRRRAEDSHRSIPSVLNTKGLYPDAWLFDGAGGPLAPLPDIALPLLAQPMVSKLITSAATAQNFPNM
jgi:hypothetical protein